MRLLLINPNTTVSMTEKAATAARAVASPGTVYGALIGALVMASLDNGMSMLDVDAYWQMIVKGGILVLAVWIDVMSGSNRR